MGQGNVSGVHQLIFGAWLCHRAEKSHYQSNVFVSLLRNSPYAAYQILIFCGLEGAHLAKLGEIVGKTRVLYSELGEITGQTRVLPCG